MFSIAIMDLKERLDQDFEFLVSLYREHNEDNIHLQTKVFYQSLIGHRES